MILWHCRYYIIVQRGFESQISLTQMKNRHDLVRLSNLCRILAPISPQDWPFRAEIASTHWWTRVAGASIAGIVKPRKSWCCRMAPHIWKNQRKNKNEDDIKWNDQSHYSHHLHNGSPNICKASGFQHMWGTRVPFSACKKQRTFVPKNSCRESMG